MQNQSEFTHQKVRAIITGATGMVGEGVLHECLQHPDVEQVLLINRKPSGFTHPNIKEIIHRDFYDFSAIEDQLNDYNACFFNLGVSSVGMNEEEYHRITYDLTLHVAQTLVRINPTIIFCYITGAGTDSTEHGKRMWARVKGKTENHLLQLPFRRAYMFRPNYMHPTKGLKNTIKLYTYVSWLYPVLKRLFPQHVITLAELGTAMIKSVTKGYDRTILEVNDIKRLAAK